MGFMDKVKGAVKTADDKLGNAIDKGKLDSQIRDEEREIDKTITEIGKAVVKALKEGKTAADADIQKLFEKIGTSEEKIEDLKKQKEAIDASGCEEEKQEEFQLDAGLLAFLEADSYEKKLEILNNLHAAITDSMIDTMAVSLDIEVKDGDIEQRYQEVLNCLLTMERFECNRLR